jgi:hypothetical protein
MNTPNAEQSMCNDHNTGFSSELDTHPVPRNTVSASFFFKNDVHKERGIYPGLSPFPLIEPTLALRTAHFPVAQRTCGTRHW